MAFKFTLPMPSKGQKVLAGRYHFKDGVMVVEDEIAKKISKILRTYYGCKIESVSEKSEAKAEDKEAASAMTKDETKR